MSSYSTTDRSHSLHYCHGRSYAFHLQPEVVWAFFHLLKKYHYLKLAELKNILNADWMENFEADSKGINKKEKASSVFSAVSQLYDEVYNVEDNAIHTVYVLLYINNFKNLFSLSIKL